MKNLELELSGVQSLSTQEMKSVDGGIGFLLAAGIILLAGAIGAAAGYGVKKAMD